MQALNRTITSIIFKRNFEELLMNFVGKSRLKWFIGGKRRQAINLVHNAVECG